MKKNTSWILAYKQIFHLLERKQKIQLYWILLVMLVGAILEMLGIGIIIPIINFYENKKNFDNFEFIFELNLIQKFSPDQIFIIFFIILFFIIYLIKNLFLAFMLFHQSKFIFNLMKNISFKLFKSYMNRSYTFHLQNNSSTLIRNVIGEVNMFNGVIKSSLLVMTELIVILGIVILLLYVDFLSTIIVGLFFIFFGFIFNFFTGSYSKKWGAKRQFHEGLRIQHVNQGLGGIKEIKLAHKEKEFINLFNEHNSKSADVGQKQNFLENIPRLWIELLVIILLSVLVLSMTALGKKFNEVAPLIVIFSMAAFRLMPSVNRIIGGIQRINYAIPIVDMIYNEFIILNNSSDKLLQKKIVNKAFNENWKFINVENIFYKYPGSEKYIINKISLKIKRNTTIGVIGESGSGKSTLINIILGLLPVESGDIKIDEESIYGNLDSWQKLIGYVPQKIYLTDDSLRNNIAYGLKNEDIENDKINNAINLSHLSEFVNSLDKKENTLVGEDGVRISGGQKQRIGIARALYHNPEIIILDEATSSLDPITETEIMNDINLMQRKKTIIIISHKLSTISKCDIIYEVKNNTLKEYKNI